MLKAQTTNHSKNMLSIIRCKTPVNAETASENKINTSIINSTLLMIETFASLGSTADFLKPKPILNILNGANTYVKNPLRL